MNNRRSFQYLPMMLAFSLLVIVSPQAALSAEKGTSVPLDTRVERLERRISRLTDLMLQVDALKRENSELRGQIELQSHTIDSLKRRQRDLYIDIDQRLSQMQGTAKQATEPLPKSSSTVAPQPVTVKQTQVSVSAKPAVQDIQQVQQSASVSSEEEAEYQKAFRLLTPAEKRYPDAIKALTAFLQKYPNSKLADNAQYWLAEANYVSQNNAAALMEFEKLIAQFPGSPKVAGALLKIGYLQHASGQIDQAKTALDKVIASYPDSSAASMAKKRLQRIQQEN